MTLDEIRMYLLEKPYAIEDYPFDLKTPVYKVGGKMFALLSFHESDRLSINLKNTLENNNLLRDMYEEIVPGYHQNKMHWNTVYCDRKLEDNLIKRLIDNSYELVYNLLTKKIRKILEIQNGGE